MSALEIFEKVPKTKEDINDCVATIKEEFLNGTIEDILAADLFLKKIEELVKGVREDKEIKAVVLQELEKYPEKTVKIHGCEITKVSRSAWQYDLCGDKDLYQLEQIKKDADDQIKSLQKQLQVMTKEQSRNDMDTGEEYTVYPASKTYTETFSIRIL